MASPRSDDREQDFRNPGILSKIQDYRAKQLILLSFVMGRKFIESMDAGAVNFVK